MLNICIVYRCELELDFETGLRRKQGDEEEESENPQKTVLNLEISLV